MRTNRIAIDEQLLSRLQAIGENPSALARLLGLTGQHMRQLQQSPELFPNEHKALLRGASENLLADIIAGHARGTRQLDNLQLDYASRDGLHLPGMQIGNLDMVQCVLTKATLSCWTIANGEIRRTNLRETDFTAGQLSDVRFQGSQLDRCRFDRAALRSCSFATLERQTSLSHGSFIGTQLVETTFHQCVLDSGDFTGAQIKRCRLKYTRARQANFAKAKLEETTCRRVDFSYARFVDAQLGSSTFAEVVGGSGLAGPVGEKYAGCDFTYSDLEGADLAGSLLMGCNFRNANLRGANLVGARLNQADFDGANLDGALMSQAQLRTLHCMTPQQRRQLRIA